MTRLYLKIFITFWLATALIIVATNTVIQQFDSSPKRCLHKHQQDSDFAPALVLLHQMVGSAINRNLEEVTQDMRDLPAWSTRYFYIVDEQGREVLDRELPPGTSELLPELTNDSPFGHVVAGDRKLFGRHLILNDGNPIRLVTVSALRGETSSIDMLRQLFLNNIWPLLLIAVLISGSACFLLARFFGQGISTLQAATRRIADGDLSVRVSPHLRRRDEIAALGRDFDHMTERLEKAMLEQKRLIKDVSHELRSPLARLQVALGLAQQRSDGSINAELERIKQAADYLNDVISGILALPVHDNGGWELNDTLDLRALLENLIEHYRAEAGRRQVSIQLHTTLEEALVSTHGNMLEGVFDNVLRNALHHTRTMALRNAMALVRNPTPPTRRDSRIDIYLEAAQNQDGYQVRICDAGPGVPADQLEDIFRPFYRTDQARDRESGGYGLGLAIAQRSVALHGGQISAANRPSGGLCVTVQLPPRHN